MINGFRMYLHGGYWYFVDYPQAFPLRASRPYYRTGGVPGIFVKWFGVMSLIAGTGFMFGEGAGFVVSAAFLVSFGIFGAVAST